MEGCKLPMFSALTLDPNSAFDIFIDLGPAHLGPWDDLNTWFGIGLKKKF
jgi:hypothetical protein